MSLRAAVDLCINAENCDTDPITSSADPFPVYFPTSETDSDVNSTLMASPEAVDVRFGLVGLFSILTVLGAVILATIVGNVFVVAAIVLERNLHNVANYLVASLAIADLMVAALVMPLAAVNEVSTRWFLGKELCDAWISFDVLCCTASILHLVAISLDRYWAVTRFDYIHNRSARRILAMIGASWGIGIVISFPPLFIKGDSNYDPNATGVCLISQDLGYTIFSTAGAFYVPCAAMMVIYLKVFRAARARIRKKQFKAAAGGNDNNAHDGAPPSGLNVPNSRRAGDDSGGALSADCSVMDTPVGERIINQRTLSDDDEGAGSSTGSHASTGANLAIVSGTTASGPQRYPSATVTLTVLTCDDDDDDNENNSVILTPDQSNDETDDVDMTSPTCLSTPATFRRPTELALRHFNKNGVSIVGTTSSQRCRPLTSSFSATAISGLANAGGPGGMCLSENTSPRGNASSVRRSTGNHLLAISHGPSPAASLRGSWLDLTKQFIMDRMKDSPPKSKEQRAKERLEQKRERKAARTLAIITGSFICCWLPFFILAILRPFCADACYTPPLLLSVINWLGYFNSLLNPVIYTVFNPDFRSAFHKILFGKYRISRPRQRDRDRATNVTQAC